MRNVRNYIAIIVFFCIAICVLIGCDFKNKTNKPMGIANFNDDLDEFIGNQPKDISIGILDHENYPMFNYELDDEGEKQIVSKVYALFENVIEECEYYSEIDKLKYLLQVNFRNPMNNEYDCDIYFNIIIKESVLIVIKGINGYENVKRYYKLTDGHKQIVSELIDIVDNHRILSPVKDNDLALYQKSKNIIDVSTDVELHRNDPLSAKMSGWHHVDEDELIVVQDCLDDVFELITDQQFGLEEFEYIFGYKTRDRGTKASLNYYFEIDFNSNIGTISIKIYERMLEIRSGYDVNYYTLSESCNPIIIVLDGFIA